MLHIFGGLKDFINPSSGDDKPVVEGFVAKLHYRVTGLVLLVCCLLVTAIEYIGLGTHIDCIQDGLPDNWPIPSHVMNTYCFITSTFILPRHLEGPVGVGGKLYPGVGVEQAGEDREYKSYYQWVPFVLFLQCCMFYVPHMLFKIWESGKVNGIISGLHQSEALVQEEERITRHKALARYFVKSLNTHNIWALKLYLADLLLFVNVIFNIYFIDFFLDGEFSTYGFQVASFVDSDPMVRTDPMTRVFPRMTKCIYKKFGSSGTIQTHDALCLLPINVINEKIYVFLWFWLIALAALTAVSILIHTAQILIPALVSTWIKKKARKRAGIQQSMNSISKELELGDWKLLNVLSYNMAPIVLGEFITELAAQVAAQREKLEDTLEPSDSNENVRKPLLTPI